MAATVGRPDTFATRKRRGREGPAVLQRLLENYLGKACECAEVRRRIEWSC
jgi:hypothetical protein